MRTRIHDIDMYYEDRGSGVPLLCLPAFPFDGRMYREQLALADVARVIIPDYRGTGRSSATTGISTMDRLAQDMVALLDELAIDRAVVLGASMGDYVAFAMYRRCPERCRGFIIADTRAEADNAATQERRRQTVALLRAAGTSALLNRVSDLFAATTRDQRPLLVEEMQRVAQEQSAEGLALITQGMALRPDNTALLAKLTVPSIVLCGEEDTVSPPEGMRALAEIIPTHPPFHLIPNAGHLAPLEQPELVNGIIRQFLARV